MYRKKMELKRFLRGVHEEYWNRGVLIKKGSGAWEELVER